MLLLSIIMLHVDINKSPVNRIILHAEINDVACRRKCMPPQHILFNKIIHASNDPIFCFEVYNPTVMNSLYGFNKITV